MGQERMHESTNFSACLRRPSVACLILQCGEFVYLLIGVKVAQLQDIFSMPEEHKISNEKRMGDFEERDPNTIPKHGGEWGCR